MKKLFLCLSLLFIGALSFADIWIKQNITGPGIFLDYSTNYKDRTLAQCIDFSPVDAISVSVLYEFNSEEDSTIHWLAGGDFGLSLCAAGLYFCADGGFNTLIKDYEKFSLNLNTNLGLGISCDIFNSYRFFSIVSSDFIFLKKGDKIDCFIGPGLELTAIPDFSYNRFWLTAYLGLKLTGGIRF